MDCDTEVAQKHLLTKTSLDRVGDRNRELTMCLFSEPFYTDQRQKKQGRIAGRAARGESAARRLQRRSPSAPEELTAQEGDCYLLVVGKQRGW